MLLKVIHTDTDTYIYSEEETFVFIHPSVLVLGGHAAG